MIARIFHRLFSGSVYFKSCFSSANHVLPVLSIKDMFTCCVYTASGPVPVVMWEETAYTMGDSS